MRISCSPRWFTRYSFIFILSLALLACFAPSVAGAAVFSANSGPIVHRTIYLPRGKEPASPTLGSLAGKVSIMPGFPVMTTETPGTYHAGPGINVLVGDITGDGKPDFLATSLANGPLYAWEPNGKVVPGWPAGQQFAGAAYAALGKLSKTIPGQQVVVGYMGGSPSALAAFDGHGHLLPGWPVQVSNYIATPPTLADINGNGIDDIFVEEENWTLAGYDAHGKPLPGWPVQVDNGQQMFTPTIADIDGDGKPEIISASESISPGGVKIYAWHGNGTRVKGFPITVPNGFVETFPVVADVLGLGKPQLIFTAYAPNDTQVLIYSGTGVLLKTITIPGATAYGRAIAIARLDNSPNPDIVVQTNTTLAVVHGDGTYVSGWPQNLSYNSTDNSSPVIGDVTGDGVPDIAITASTGSGDQGIVAVYSATGKLEFQMQLEIGGGGVPAISDLLGNGRNDLLVVGSPWDGTERQYPKVYAFDFHGAGPYGKIPWPQFGRDPEHHSCFPDKGKANFCTG